MQWNELFNKLFSLYFLVILVINIHLICGFQNILFSKQISAVGVDEETTSVLETTVDGNKLNETDNETTQATELPCNPKTDDNDQNEISPPLDNLQQNETETEMNANVLIKSELLDQDDKPHNLSSNVFMSTDSSLGSDAKILIKSEEGVSRCHPANDLDAAVTAVKEEAKTSQIE